MKPRSGSAKRIAAGLVLALLFASVVYRAATQALTHDEALTYRLYLSTPAREIFQHYDANNHFLAVLLMRLSTWLFGFSEFSQRLPTVASAALYFLTAYRLSLLLFGADWFLLLAVALLSGNPFVLDFLVAARGYGPALALFLFAFYCLLRYATENPPPRRLLHAGAAGLSLSVVANLALLYPVLAAIALFLLTEPSEGPPAAAVGKRGRSQPVPRPGAGFVALHFILPIVAVLALFWLLSPVNEGVAQKFYTGARSLRLSFERLAEMSFAHNEGWGGALRQNGPLAVWNGFAAYVLFPALPLAGLLVWRRRGSLTPPALALLWASAVMLGSLLLAGLARLVVSFPYPYDRSAIYMLPLLSLLLLLIARLSGLRGVKPALSSLGAIFVVFYALQFQCSYFNLWRYDADNKRLLQRLAEEAKGRAGPLTVSGSWQLEPSLSYYRTVRRLSWMRPVVRGLLGRPDFSLVIAQDKPIIKELKLAPVFEGPVSGTVLTKPGARP